MNLCLPKTNVPQLDVPSRLQMWILNTFPRLAGRLQGLKFSRINPKFQFRQSWRAP